MDKYHSNQIYMDTEFAIRDLIMITIQMGNSWGLIMVVIKYQQFVTSFYLLIFKNGLIY
jgi:hypothetical protein